jgi:thioredoxin reductase (NADPH)
VADFDLIVIGAGVAGLTAAMVAARHGLRVAVIAASGPGGQIINAERVENFPGIPQPTAGHELGSRLFEQAEAGGAQFMLDTVEGLSTAGEGAERIVHAAGQDFSASAVIIAAGSTLRPLGITGEEKLLGKGVSHCASCDAPLFKGRAVCVIGGGDAAFEEALVLSEYAAGVAVFHRGEMPRAQQHLRARVEATASIVVSNNTVVEEVLGDEAVRGVRLRDGRTGATREHRIDGVFIAIGLDPATAFLNGVLKLDASGHIETDIMMRTSLDGVFAAGDIRKNSVAQLAAIAGDGATAAISAFRYLKELGCGD